MFYDSTYITFVIIILTLSNISYSVTVAPYTFYIPLLDRLDLAALY